MDYNPKILEGGLDLWVKATPKARQNAIIGLTPQGLKIHITAAPEKGQANEALIALLAKRCGVAKQSVTLLKGDTSPLKQFHIKGDGHALLALLLPDRS